MEMWKSFNFYFELQGIGISILMLYRIPECSFHPGKIFWMLYWFSNCQCLIHFSFNEINFISSKLLNFVDSNNGEESPLVPPSSLVKGNEK